MNKMKPQTANRKSQIQNNQSGNSLIEIMLSISIFIVIGALSLNIFKSTVESQKDAIAGQNTQESMRYLFEVMSKEIRSAQNMGNTCDASLGITANDEIYNTDGGANELYFKNKDDECVAYFIGSGADAGRLIMERGGTALPVTPNDIVVTDLDFIISDNSIGTLPGAKIQPRVMIKMEVEGLNGKQHTVMQTTVSSRNYE